MKRTFVLPLAVLLFILMAFINGCKEDEAINDPEPTTNHTFKINNSGSNTTQCTARQFVSLKLKPTDNSSTSQTYSFVSNPNTNIEVKVNLPKATSYEITFEISVGGPFIKWDSIALAVGGATDVTLSTNNVGFYDNSYVAGIRSSSNNIPCN